jgi:hypothetical protein
MSVLKDVGINTIKEDIGEEDFWILEQNEKVAMVEVKGKDHVVKRDDLYKLDTHREERNKPDNFPALLIVNTFNKAESLRDKDTAIGSDEIRRAVNLRLLILRTIDLIRLYNLIQNNKIELSSVINCFKSNSGWMKVTNEGIEIITK